MRFAFAVTALAFVPQVATGATDVRVASAAKAAGCDLDPALAFGAGLGHLPGSGDASVQVLATLSGGTDDRSLGDLCVALVREDHGRFSGIAKLDGPTIEPSNEIEQVTTVYVNVDKTVFRFRPDETAFAVAADGEYNSEATNWTWSTLYLFRRQGRGIVPIFHAKVSDETIDKGPDGKTTGGRWVVRFDTAQHQGAYDLLLQRYHGKDLRRFVWNGSRYAPVSQRR